MEEPNFDYSKLKGRMTEMQLTQEKLADRINIGRTALNLKLNNNSEFTADEILRICNVLGIVRERIPEYFFKS